MSVQHLDHASPATLAKFSTIIVLCLLSSIVIATRGQQGLETKVLPPSVGGQCPSVEERERVRNEIHQLVNNIVASSTHTSYSHTCITAHQDGSELLLST